MQLEREALGTIQRKPELYCIPLKLALVTRGRLQQERQELIIDHIPQKDMQWAIDGVIMPWHQANVH